MRMTSYKESLILPTAFWLSQVLASTRHLDHSAETRHFGQDIIVTFFDLLNRLLADGKYRLVEDRHEVTELMVALIMGDLEGYTDEPREFTPLEIDTIIAAVVNLYDDLLVTLDAGCLTPGVTVAYNRMIGSDILIRYESYHPSRIASPKQIADIYQRKGSYDADTDHERCWL